MPTSFKVFSLGHHSAIDPTEGNSRAENANVLVGETFGDSDAPLVHQMQTFSGAGAGFSGGSSTSYDSNNENSNDQFSIDDGPPQTFDGLAVYNATLTYGNGETAEITAVVFQDTDGNTYLAPEMSDNSDQAKFVAMPLTSVTLNSLLSGSNMNMGSSRMDGDYVMCFAEGTLIQTPDGEKSVEEIMPGDLVMTLDNGPQPVRWIRGNSVDVTKKTTPIRITAGALNPSTPNRDLIVSRQHKMLVRSKLAKRMFGSQQILVAAAKLLHLQGVRELKSRESITYWHFMCDQHEVVFANGAPAETLFLGDAVRIGLSAEALDEISAIFPDLAKDVPYEPARPVPEIRRQHSLIRRLRQNNKDLLEA
jgi:hypothetical protein